MVRSTLINSKLLTSFWTKALKMTVYIVNQIATKVVSKTPFKMLKSWKLSLQHMHIWECPSEVRIYNPQEIKMDPKTINGYFIGYV